MAGLGARAPIGCPDTPLMLIGRTTGQDDAYGRSGPGDRLPRDPDDPTLWLPGQGRANACGTTTLAYVLRYLLGPGAPPRAEIDRALRRGDLFSAPRLLLQYARGLGLAARAYNDAELPLVLDLVDHGIPVLALLDTTPLDLRDTANLHWVAVVAHCGDRIGIYNPHGFQEELDLASFEAHWREARIFGLPAWRRFALAIARRPAALPTPRRPSVSFVGAELAAAGVASAVNRAVSMAERLRLARATRPDPRLVPDALGVVLAGLEAALGSTLLLAGAAGGAVEQVLRTRGAARPSEADAGDR